MPQVSTPSIPALTAGTYRLAVKHRDYAPKSSAPVTVDGSTPVEGVEIKLQAGASIAGRVIAADNQPVSWAAVIVGPDRAANLGGPQGGHRQATDGTGIAGNLRLDQHDP